VTGPPIRVSYIAARNTGTTWSEATLPVIAVPSTNVVDPSPKEEKNPTHSQRKEGHVGIRTGDIVLTTGAQPCDPKSRRLR